MTESVSNTLSHFAESDFPFTFDPAHDLLRSTAYVTARRSALWPLLPKRPAGQPPYTPNEAYATVLAAWRRRVLYLHNAGWESLKEGRQIVFMRNCPPTGITSGRRSYVCRRSRVCPWCYAREVVMTAYRAAEQACFAESGDLKLKKWTLLGLRYAATPHIQRSVDYVAKNIHLFRRYDIEEAEKVTRIAGAMSWSHLWPNREGQLGFRRSTLFLWPRGEVLPASLQADGRQSKALAENFTKADLGNLLVWLLTYPTGLLYGDAGIMKEILSLRCGRMCTVTGLFRAGRIAWQMEKLTRKLKDSDEE